jgi:hypothetical protein
MKFIVIDSSDSEANCICSEAKQELLRTFSDTNYKTVEEAKLNAWVLANEPVQKDGFVRVYKSFEFRWVIELNTIEELIEFYKKYGYNLVMRYSDSEEIPIAIEIDEDYMK